MASRKPYSARRRDANIHGDTREAGSDTHYSAERGVRRSLRREVWADGFITSNGTQIPLFVRRAQHLK